MQQYSCEEANSCSAVKTFPAYYRTRSCWGVGDGRSMWCGRPGHQEHKERENGRKMNILNQKFLFTLSTNFKIFNQNKLNSINN